MTFQERQGFCRCGNRDSQAADFPFLFHLRDAKRKAFPQDFDCIFFHRTRQAAKKNGFWRTGKYRFSVFHNSSQGNPAVWHSDIRQGRKIFSVFSRAAGFSTLCAAPTTPTTTIFYLSFLRLARARAKRQIETRRTDAEFPCPAFTDKVRGVSDRMHHEKHKSLSYDMGKPFFICFIFSLPVFSFIRARARVQYKKTSNPSIRRITVKGIEL